mgnify:CR=1 FL=1
MRQCKPLHRKYLLTTGIPPKSESPTQYTVRYKDAKPALGRRKGQLCNRRHGHTCRRTGRLRRKGAKPMKEQPIEMDGERYVGTTVLMGNPHLVIFVNDIEAIDLTVIGPKPGESPSLPRPSPMWSLPKYWKRER